LTPAEVAMTKNIHPIERIVRGLIGLGLLAIVFVGPKSLWGLIGIIPLFTAIVGWCPPYQWLGINTAGSSKD
jgi:hypothetical protein